MGRLITGYVVVAASDGCGLRPKQRKTPARRSQSIHSSGWAHCHGAATCRPEVPCAWGVHIAQACEETQLLGRVARRWPPLPELAPAHRVSLLFPRAVTQSSPFSSYTAGASPTTNLGSQTLVILVILVILIILMVILCCDDFAYVTSSCRRPCSRELIMGRQSRNQSRSHAVTPPEHAKMR